MKVELFNNNLLVKEIKRDEKDSFTEQGLYISSEDLDDEQVSQGVIVQFAEGFNVGDRVMFHKTLPVDVNMKLEGDSELTQYFFIKREDIICKLYA